MTDRSSVEDETLSRLAGETGAALGDLGVRPDDERWIRAHAQTLESLFEARRPPRGAWLRPLGALYRLARRAARTAR
ncbi:MAG TPA: hypothetical protein VE007_05820 [Thermoanaerobaculia bacterium]|nr:hypothetical protein [Thermoanaerobaculia bacterium]